MTRPEVTIENYQAVFDYYNNRGPNPAFAKFGHAVMGRIFKPEIHFAPGAEQTIDDQLTQGAQVILTTNHDSKYDQYNLASLIKRARVLRPMIGRSVIMARYGLFSEPGVRGKLQRVAIDALGSYPAFRHKDVVGAEDSPERKLQRQASDISLLLSYYKTERDKYHLGGYAEGERTPEGQPHTVVRELKHGFGKIYTNIEHGRRVMVVTGGQYYGEDDARDYKHPVIYIGEPIVNRINDATEFTGVLHEHMQRDLDMAVDLYST